MSKRFTYIISNEGDLSKIKFSADPSNTSFTTGVGKDISIGTPDIDYETIAFIKQLNCIWTHGEFYAQVDLSNLVTNEQFDPISSLVSKSIQRGSLGKINGESIESGDITIDMNLYKIVPELPTEDIYDNKIYVVPGETSSTEKSTLDEYLYDPTNSSWMYLGQYKAEIDLSPYLKKVDADDKYMPKSGSTSGGGSGASLSISTSGSFNNFGDNGQAFNAVRDVSTKSITGKPINAGSFGVKSDGTTAFSHKTYNTFNKDTGANSGARNTAVLTFSGLSGLRYAKNTGSTNDVADSMFRYVGVIDSQDEKQRCYSAKQVDELLAQRDKEIADLKKLVESLTK